MAIVHTESQTYLYHIYSIFNYLTPSVFVFIGVLLLELKSPTLTLFWDFNHILLISLIKFDIYIISVSDRYYQNTFSSNTCTLHLLTVIQRYEAINKRMIHCHSVFYNSEPRKRLDGDPHGPEILPTRRRPQGIEHETTDNLTAVSGKK